IFKVQQRGKTFCPDLVVLREWENNHADSNGCHNDNSRRDKNSAEESAEISSEVDDSITFGNFSQQHGGKEKARNRQENVNAARDSPITKQIAEYHTQDSYMTFGNISKQHGGKEKARNSQENVNAARDSPITKKMEEYHTQDGKPAYPMELWSVAACWEIFRDTFRC